MPRQKQALGQHFWAPSRAGQDGKEKGNSMKAKFDVGPKCPAKLQTKTLPPDTAKGRNPVL